MGCGVYKTGKNTGGVGSLSHRNFKKAHFLLRKFPEKNKKSGFIQNTI